MQKKMLKQSGMSKTSAAEAADDVFLSSEAARAQEAMGVDQANNAPATPQERFLASAMEELSQLDPNSETFFYDSTSTLVNLALRESFGDRITRNEGYPQMKDKIVHTIMQDERYSEIMGDFLENWSKVATIQNEQAYADMEHGEELPEGVDNWSHE